MGNGLDNPEIILNLWLVLDENGFVYSLRARCYIGAGTDEEKLAFLRPLAESDYLIAKAFAVPERFHTTFVEGERSKKMPVIHMNDVELLGGASTIFEDVFRELESDLPATTKLNIRQDPLLIVTPLMVDENGELRPRFARRVKL
jgi:hypothetical protein